MRKQWLSILCILTLCICNMFGCGHTSKTTLTNDWKDMQISLDGQVFEFPFQFDELADIALVDISGNIMESDFVLMDDVKVMIGAQSIKYVIIRWISTEMNATAIVVNDTDEIQNITDCKVVGMDVYATTEYSDVAQTWIPVYPNVVISGGAQFGVEPLEIYNYYGEPSGDMTFIDENGKTSGDIYYEIVDGSDIVKYLRFYFYDDQLVEIELVYEKYVHNRLIED